ncbi:MAG: hypothetical protein KME35_13480 [Aphanocapsa sp. GSE-SYN-MK-11-07L]|jgi:hypothetical protein|nr:hypothetical protein [Aphanocapsa sp. GSE-SYN-MK-11-07L]
MKGLIIAAASIVFNSIPLFAQVARAQTVDIDSRARLPYDLRQKLGESCSTALEYYWTGIYNLETEGFFTPIYGKFEYSVFRQAAMAIDARLFAVDQICPRFVTHELEAHAKERIEVMRSNVDYSNNP